MVKENIIRFLKDNRRGVYDLIADTYQELLTSMSVSMALTLIKEDLEKITQEKVEMNYFSLNRAVSKLKKAGKVKVKTVKNWDFKDDYEIKKPEGSPGKFKID